MLFDIKNMFPNISTEECRIHIEDIVLKSNTNSIKILEIMLVFTIKRAQSYFQFNTTCHTQNLDSQWNLQLIHF